MADNNLLVQTWQDLDQLDEEGHSSNWLSVRLLYFGKIFCFPEQKAINLNTLIPLFAQIFLLLCLLTINLPRQKSQCSTVILKNISWLA